MPEAAIWEVFVMEFARSKNQPWVDLISGMYQEGVMDLPFSFILARNGTRVGLVDTGSRTSAPAPSALTVPPDLPSAPIVPPVGLPPFVPPRPPVVLKSPAAPIPDQPAPSMWP